MLGHRRIAVRIAASVVLAAALATAPLDRTAPPAGARQGCALADEIRSTTCRLNDGQPVEGTLDGPTGSATYRVDALAPDLTLNLVLAAQGGSTRISVIDWRGDTLAEATRDADAPEVRLSATLPLPGAYGVRVSGDAPPESPGYRLTAQLQSPPAPANQFWPPAYRPGAGPLRDERQVVRTPRVGTPTTPSVHGRALGAPPDGMLTDFTFVADVQFDRLVSPSAITVRFRYEPEAGGGTGYILILDPFGGTASLDAFEEGQRQSIVADQPLPVMPTARTANRLVLTTSGPEIRATLDGQPLVESTDDRFGRGLIVVGASTWSDPVEVTFDHIQVTTPLR
jgi:hypothetical protein